jgi:alpha-maltose-1-phosphate synthase
MFPPGHCSHPVIEAIRGPPQLDMNPASSTRQRRFVLAVPFRTIYYIHSARALESAGALRLAVLGTRRGIQGVAGERTRLNPLIGLITYAAAKSLPQFQSESIRFRLYPWFDRWALRHLQPGDHVYSSHGFTNECFAWARRHGGKTFLDAVNSHPDFFWRLLTEEYSRWQSPVPPVAPHYQERCRAMMAEVDYVLSPSRFVTQSFLAEGFKPAQILSHAYPVDLRLFQPALQPRPKNRPLTLISTGALTLRKGTPYLLEAFRRLRQRHPSCRLILIRDIHNSIRPVFAKYRDLPIEWSPPLPQPQLVQLLQSADLFVLPSLEEGLVRTALEAMACGLPVVLTPHCGADDFVQPGVNGEVVPIRDPAAIVEAVMKWADTVMASSEPPRRLVDEHLLSAERFERGFLDQLHGLGLLG